MGNSSKRTARTVAKKERAKSALDLRLEGKGYREIAALLKRDVATIFRDIQEAVADIGKEEAILVRDLELTRLDARNARLLSLLERSYADEKTSKEAATRNQARKTQVLAEEALRKNDESRRKLLGVDAPAKSEVTGKDGAPLYAGPVIFIPPEDEEPQAPKEDVDGNAGNGEPAATPG